MPFPVIGAYILGILLILILGRVMVFPLKVIFRLVYNGIIGGVTLWLVNVVGSLIGFHLPLTVWTALLVGFLGVPGVALLILWQLFFSHLVIL